MKKMEEDEDDADGVEVEASMEIDGSRD